MSDRTKAEHDKQIDLEEAAKAAFYKMTDALPDRLDQPGWGDIPVHVRDRFRRVAAATAAAKFPNPVDTPQAITGDLLQALLRAPMARRMSTTGLRLPGGEFAFVLVVVDEKDSPIAYYPMTTLSDVEVAAETMVRDAKRIFSGALWDDLAPEPGGGAKGR